MVDLKVTKATFVSKPMLNLKATEASKDIFVAKLIVNVKATQVIFVPKPMVSLKSTQATKTTSPGRHEENLALARPQAAMRRILRWHVPRPQ